MASRSSKQFKVVLLGEGCVGKTSLTLRYCEGKFNDKHITTLQVHTCVCFLYNQGSENFKIQFEKSIFCESSMFSDIFVLIVPFCHDHA